MRAPTRTRVGPQHQTHEDEEEEARERLYVTALEGRYRIESELGEGGMA